MANACLIKVRGVVQGVGFRPFVYRLATDLRLSGWVLNGEEGVSIHLEGDEPRIQSFLARLKSEAPPASRIVEIEVAPAPPAGFTGFAIRESERKQRPTVRISPDLPVCDDCLRELADPAESPPRLSLHQLHQLRAALHDRSSAFPTTARTPP